MKSIRFESVLSMLALFLSMSTYAQVGVGTTNPDASAILELKEDHE